MRYAPEPRRLGAQALAVFADGEVKTNGATLREYGDYDVVPVNPHYQKPLNAVNVRTTSELGDVLQVANRLGHLRKSAYTIGKLAAHEARHGALFAALTDVHDYMYGAYIMRRPFNAMRPGPLWEVVPYAFAYDTQLPKLAFASTYMPSGYSDGDAEALQLQFGYTPRTLRQKLQMHAQAGMQPVLQIPRRGLLSGR